MTRAERLELAEELARVALSYCTYVDFNEEGVGRIAIRQDVHERDLAHELADVLERMEARHAAV